jgi:hypothetical protein
VRAFLLRRVNPFALTCPLSYRQASTALRHRRASERWALVASVLTAFGARECRMLATCYRKSSVMAIPCPPYLTFTFGLIARHRRRQRGRAGLLLRWPPLPIDNGSQCDKRYHRVRLIDCRPPDLPGGSPQKVFTCNGRRTISAERVRIVDEAQLSIGYTVDNSARTQAGASR